MISIIVPCYNCENTIRYCVESIEKQTYTNLEIILVNDGSTDNTYQRCNELAKMDKRIRVIHQENRGLMNAWKNGVEAAEGEYIAFCDSDDYIDCDMLERLGSKASEYDVDVVLCGLVAEYENGVKETMDNQLPEGYYSKEDIQKKVLPYYFSNGDMESGIMLAARVTKLFRKKILLENYHLFAETVTIGEDDVASFASVLAADSIYCINNFFPYHYVRNDNSMMGKYDEAMFDKLLEMRMQLEAIAEEYQYTYKNQIDACFLSNVLICMKKEICRTDGKRYADVKKQLMRMRDNEYFAESIDRIDLQKFSLKSKVFATLVKKKQYYIVYTLTKIMNFIGVGKA